MLTASRFVRGSATGLGDANARVKVNLRRSEPLAVGVLADVRFPTGSEKDLLGAGAFAARGLAIVSPGSATSRRTRTWATCIAEANSRVTRCWAPWASSPADALGHGRGGRDLSASGRRQPARGAGSGPNGRPRGGEWR